MGTKTAVQVIFMITLDNEIEYGPEGLNIFPLGITITGRTKDPYSGDLDLLHKAASLAASKYWYAHAKEQAGENVSEITISEFKS